MKIALIGYGKMGKVIKKLAKAKGHSIALIIDVDNLEDFTSEKLQIADVAIDFTSPAAAADNITKCLNAHIPVVSGTTGWLDQWDVIEQLCREKNGSLFYASNYSIGVNVLFALNQYLTGIMKNFSQYNVEMKEVHHIHKLDAPSGTALTLAEKIIEQIPGKLKWALANDMEDPQTTLSIEAVREGEVNGFHSISYESSVDTITIQHNAKSREGFAGGAIMAAEYIIGKKGIHNMKNMLNF